MRAGAQDVAITNGSASAERGTPSPPDKGIKGTRINLQSFWWKSYKKLSAGATSAACGKTSSPSWRRHYRRWASRYQQSCGWYWIGISIASQKSRSEYIINLMKSSNHENHSLQSTMTTQESASVAGSSLLSHWVSWAAIFFLYACICNFFRWKMNDNDNDRKWWSHYFNFRF